MEVIERINIRNALVNRIKEAIAANYFKPGEKLPTERLLATTLGVSRTSVREGLRQLESMGLVTIKHGKGTFVNEVVPSLLLRPLASMLLIEKPKIIELMQVRKLIERECVKLASQKATPEQISRLDSILRQMESTLENPAEFIKYDIAFHVVLSEASQNSIFPKILDLIREVFTKQQEAIVRLPGRPRIAYKFHLEILEAIKRHNTVKAERKMMEHLNDIEQTLLSQYHSL